MRTFIKIIPLFLLTLAMAQTAPADHPERPPHPPKMDKEKMLEHLTESLDLSASQVESIKKIDASFESEEAKIEGQMKALREKKREIMKQKKAEIDKVLTREQKAKLHEMKEKRRERRKERRDRAFE